MKTPNEILIEALQKISNPVKYLREKAEREGSAFDENKAVHAIIASKDGEFL